MIAHPLRDFRGYDSITVARDPEYAPCCFILCREYEHRDAMGLRITWSTRRDEHTVLIQSDWDFPGVARAFGWTGDDADIEGARAFLSDIAGSGRFIPDPGYFDGKGVAA